MQRAPKPKGVWGSGLELPTVGELRRRWAEKAGPGLQGRGAPKRGHRDSREGGGTGHGWTEATVQLGGKVGGPWGAEKNRLKITGVGGAWAGGVVGRALDGSQACSVGLEAVPQSGCVAVGKALGVSTQGLLPAPLLHCCARVSWGQQGPWW